MKTQEELNAIKEEIENVSKKLRELTEDELKIVTGGNLEDHIKKLGSEDLKGIGLDEDPILQY